MSNRLAFESSPYLLQHAENPVQWYPWGSEALDRAKSEDRPIFLSIGYSACHWCHVMERESFENQEIANFLNEHFVNIKVDREERPDLDQIYMNAVMALRGGGGGWPLSVFLTPDQQVFFGGTYWPPRSRMDMPGFDRVLASVLDAFQNRRPQVELQSGQISERLNHVESVDDSVSLGASLLHSAVHGLHAAFDRAFGGFGNSPKFPHPMDLELLMRLARRWPTTGIPDRQAVFGMVDVTLRRMASGGIYDHLAGGFARYSVDERWLVPHFEKMLYDNSLLARLYIDMYLETGADCFRDVGQKTLDYMLRDMAGAHGEFFSTEDADSEGEEGKFYVWSRDEILEILGPEIGELFCRVYQVTESGNFEGHNILWLGSSLEQWAEQLNQEPSPFLSCMETAREKLLEIRNRRVRPGLDDKVIVSWNALAISAMARAAVVLEDECASRYLIAGQKAAQFVLDRLTDDRGRLLHTWRNGQAKFDAYLDDYSYLIVALLDLYQASFDERWIDHAVAFAESMVEHFQGENGFYFTADDQEQLIARTITFQDSSVPSGNAMAALGLLRLGRLLGKPAWTELAASIIKGARPLMDRSPLASGQTLVALQWMLEPSVELVFFAPAQIECMRMRKLLQQRGLDSVSLVCRSPEDAFHSSMVEEVLRGKQMQNDQPTLFICNQHVCQKPVLGWQAIKTAMSLMSNQPIVAESGGE